PRRKARSERCECWVEFFSADDFFEGLAPIETPRLAWCWPWPWLWLRCDCFERCERSIEIEFVVEVLGADDFAQPRRVLSVPASCPSERMARGDVGGIPADERGRDLSRAFELGDVGTTGRFLQPPMGMQFVLDLPSRRVRPFTARANDERRKSEY